MTPCRKWNLGYSHLDRFRREGFEYSTIPALQFARSCGSSVGREWSETFAPSVLMAKTQTSGGATFHPPPSTINHEP